MSFKKEFTFSEKQVIEILDQQKFPPKHILEADKILSQYTFESRFETSTDSFKPVTAKEKIGYALLGLGTFGGTLGFLYGANMGAHWVAENLARYIIR